MGSAPRPSPTPWEGYRLFYSQFRQRFHDTGAIAPSGAALAKAITTPLAEASGNRLRVLEVGAGTGVFTRAILRQLSRGDAFDIYEINPVFRPFLEARVQGAEGRGVECEIHMAAFGQASLPPEPYDFIISGLPLNNFAPDEVETLLGEFIGHLRPGGVFSYFEYLYIRDMKCALIHDRVERERLQAVGKVVEGFLREHPNRHTLVPWNLPPAVARHVKAA